MRERGFVPIPLIIILVVGLLGTVLYLNKTQGSLNPSKNEQQEKVSTISSFIKTPSASTSPVDNSNNISKKSPTSTTNPTPAWANDPITDDATCRKNENELFKPAFGKAPLKVKLTPSGTSNEKAGSMVGYQWDFDGDGVWDTDIVDGETYHIYDKAGTYTPIFRTRTSKNFWSKNCTYQYKITVDNNDSGIGTDMLLLDRNSFELTVKKSDYPGKDLVLFDTFKVSSKDKFTYVTPNIEGTAPWGYFSHQGVNLDKGLSYQFSITVKLTAKSGEYTNDVKVLYTKDNQTLEGPIVKFKINLQD